jgi:hypothetical protein
MRMVAHSLTHENLKHHVWALDAFRAIFGVDVIKITLL